MIASSAYLAPTPFIDSDHPSVTAFARRAADNAEDAMERARRLYLAVRDEIAYEAYLDFSDPANYRASGVLAAGKGFCVGKAALLAACARALGIPARVGYADVKNHMTSRKLYEHLQSDEFIWHSYAELRLAERWVKATPAFDARLCAKAGVSVLAFDGTADSLFQPFSVDGRRHMEYLRDRGAFEDVPFATITADFRTFYPRLGIAERLTGSFAADVERSTA